VDLTDKIIRYKIEYDTYRVKNKIKVYGKNEKRYPATDEWSESTTNWTASESLSLSSDHEVGTYSIIAWSTANYYVWAKKTFSQISAAFRPNTKKFCFWFKTQYAAGGSIDQVVLYLLAPDESNCFYREITGDVTPTSTSGSVWSYLTYALNTEDWNKTGSPDWANIQGFKIYVHGNNATVNERIDDPYFAEIAYSGSAEDSTSQGLYGVRMPEPIVDDSLQSDDDCTKKAQSLLAYYKDKVTTLTITTFGNNAFKPGDMVHVVLSNDNVDGWFRILEVRHQLEDVLWQTELLLSNEPIMIDYIFRKMFEVQKTLASNK
jgi:hypothetical protein